MYAYPIVMVMEPVTMVQTHANVIPFGCLRRLFIKPTVPG